MNSQKIALIILDGFGIRKEKEGNAIKLASMPFYNELLKKYAHTTLKTKGEYVGLEKGQFGNSEVGHLNIGSGRVVLQNSYRITKAIEDGEFFRNKKLIAMLKKLKKTNSALHLFGLCSNGGVHSQIKHLYAILELCKQNNFNNVLIHFISDGRDTNIYDGKEFLNQLNKEIKKIGIGKVVSLCGRFYAMDREKNYDRTDKFYEILSNYCGEKSFSSINEAFNYYYKNGLSDEFIVPTVLKDADYRVKKDDAILCFNFRTDRPRQIYEKLIENNFKHLFSMTNYDAKFKNKVTVVFEENEQKNCLSEVLSKNNKSQLRISETTKYAHVTYFFNLLNEVPFKNEKRIIIDGDKIDNFAKKPRMKIKEITDTIISETNNEKFDFIVVNFPNADMVGHTGNMKATINALEFLDKNLKRLCEDLKNKGYIILITADHGNADKMINSNGSVCTTHTTSDAPFIIIDNQRYQLRKDGKLANISPTVLDLMQIKKPKEFKEDSLILK